MQKILYLLFTCISLNVLGQGGSFSFTLARPATTSAGVYTQGGTLVRTLWNDVKYPSGKVEKDWDGKDDRGIKLPATETYSVKLLTNNVKHTWEGTIGNSSDSAGGLSKHRGYYHCMRGLAFSGSYGYFCTGYSEGSPSLGKFNVNRPNQKTQFFTSNTQSGDINYVAADNEMVYWGALDANIRGNSFVFATNVSNDKEVVFTRGSAYTVKYGKTYTNAISIVKAGNGLITGLAVQKKGNLLLVARADINELQIFDKKTGALINTLTVPAARSVCFDRNDDLWMISGKTNLESFSISKTGQLTPKISITGLEDPAATQASPTADIISVADGGNSQQVKFYSTSTGKELGILGTAGGYFADATVTDNKFYFNDAVGKRLTFIAYQPNGSFWVNDPGNFRVQHYSPEKKFIDRIMSLGATYSTWVDKNDITRVWADYLEFNIDYGKRLSGKTGWTLVKNWGANISSAYDKSEKFKFITTLSNGRTYGFLRSKAGREIVEFPAKGQLRFSGRTPTAGFNFVLAKDGSLQSYTKAPVGGRSVVTVFPLTGFDTQGNPGWTSQPTILATTPLLTEDDPNAAPRGEMITSTGKAIIFVPNSVKKFVDRKPQSWLTGYHLGALAKDKEQWLWRTELATNRNYKGEYPAAGFFDIGNSVNDNAGGSLCIVDQNIITSYHGEFWKNGQTNKYNHYWDNGLAIAQFGITRAETREHATPGMAGNALTPVLVKNAAGDLYLYHGDESDHAAVHRWKITGLNTIREQEIPLQRRTAQTSLQPVRKNIFNLMEGLPYNATLTDENAAGWQRFPAEENTTDLYTDVFTVNTSVLQHDRMEDPDLFIKFAKPTPAEYTVTRDLGLLKIQRSWSLSGLVAYPGNMPNGQSIWQYLEVLDEDGKIISSFYVEMNRNMKPFSAQIFGNRRLLGTGEEHQLRRTMSKFTSLNISVSKGAVTFTYGQQKPITAPLFDLAANWKKPKLLRCRFKSVNGGSVYAATLGLKNLVLTSE